MTDPLLRASALTRTYRGGAREHAALRGVSLTVAPGDWVAVTGSSGCGKSTLLHLLSGLDRPDSGEVWLAGTRLDDRDESGRALLRRRHVGFVFQFLNLVPTMTVIGNVELPLVLQGVGRREARGRSLEVLEELDAIRAFVVLGLAVVWAMPMLFMVAGLGAWHSLRRRGPAGMAVERLRRLGASTAHADPHRTGRGTGGSSAT